jgi:putative DNA primase/helicase
MSREICCGKTTLVDVLSRLVRSALTTVNATAAAIFRLVHAYQPTLLIDEADTFLTKNSDLRGILNSGYRRNSAYVIRADAIYSTWAPVAVAMIGRLPSTVEDRAVAVRLKRRRQDELIAPFRFDQTDGLGQLARMAARWATDNLEKIKNTDPAMPTTLQNREADNWRPLLAFADVAVENGQFARGGLLNPWRRPIVSRNNQPASCCLRIFACSSKARRSAVCLPMNSLCF